eukprot:gene10739-11928_t
MSADPKLDTLIHDARLYVETFHPLLVLIYTTAPMAANATVSLLHAAEVFGKVGLQYTVEFLHRADWIRRLTTLCSSSGDAGDGETHALLIDSELEWNPADVLRLLIANKAIVGGIPPARMPLNWSKAATIIDSAKIIQAEIMKHSDNSQPLTKAQNEEALVNTLRANLVTYDVVLLENAVTSMDGLLEVASVSDRFTLLNLRMIKAVVGQGEPLSWHNGIHSVCEAWRSKYKSAVFAHITSSFVYYPNALPYAGITGSFITTVVTTKLLAQLSVEQAANNSKDPGSN